MNENKKSFREIEKNASWGGQILGVLAFYFVFQFFHYAVPISAILLLPHADTYVEATGLLQDASSIIFGAWAYYIVIKRYPKKTVGAV